MALTAANLYPAAATAVQLMDTPPGCWNAATSIPGTLVPVACPPTRPRLIGPASSRSSRGECGSAAVAARAAASAAAPARPAPDPPVVDPAPDSPAPEPPAVPVAPEPGCPPGPCPAVPLAPRRSAGRPLPPAAVQAPAHRARPAPAPPVPGTVAVTGDPTGTGGALGADGTANPDEAAWMAAADPHGEDGERRCRRYHAACFDKHRARLEARQ